MLCKKHRKSNGGIDLRIRYEHMLKTIEGAEAG